MNARGYRRAVERQRRRDERSSKRKNTKENIGRGVKTFALIAGVGAIVTGVTNILVIRGVSKRKYCEGFIDGAATTAEIIDRQKTKKSEEKRNRGFFGLFTKK